MAVALTDAWQAWRRAQGSGSSFHPDEWAVSSAPLAARVGSLTCPEDRTQPWLSPLYPGAMPLFLGPGPAVPPRTPGSGTHTRWGLGAGDGSLDQRYRLCPPWVRVCAKLRASPFPDLLVCKQPFCQGVHLATSLLGGRLGPGLPLPSCRDSPGPGQGGWLGMTPVHSCAWGLRRGGVSGAEPPASQEPGPRRTPLQRLLIGRVCKSSPEREAGAGSRC